MNYSTPKQIRDKFHLIWDQISLKYLGIYLMKEISTLAEVNFGPLLIRIKDDIHRWNAISFLSLSHRIDSIKMNILPRYLYLFQALPVEIPLKHWSELDKITSRFIWQGKKLRIKFKTLQLQTEEGGLALPNFRDYFYAAQTKYLMNICNPTCQARWKDIELSIMSDPQLKQY